MKIKIRSPHASIRFKILSKKVLNLKIWAGFLEKICEQTEKKPPHDSKINT